MGAHWEIISIDMPVPRWSLYGTTCL